MDASADSTNLMECSDDIVDDIVENVSTDKEEKVGNVVELYMITICGRGPKEQVFF